jgi:hypothetical protein
MLKQFLDAAAGECIGSSSSIYILTEYNPFFLFFQARQFKPGPWFGWFSFTQLWATAFCIQSTMFNYHDYTGYQTYCTKKDRPPKRMSYFVEG